ncbi:sarcosine oxidase subunit alpha family protein [Falsiroseomonas selenitidurans]|uniref:Sarcosine oxidase subunit alpha family protein n=1 Tax=Falsiroseomonas selenitidurans TaxID=2716335 RepID=A0ABX1E099_9PROT|nr:sarcosine oxidase subunit alpha family protein [Falsiroseomonas selenitidurans]NKC30528.1 sarcosine oxidase subunit alpha family protein [Falsiroseomonas selenitidurans]
MTRLASGGRIDRAQTLRFSFDGTPYTGQAGDTLASALLANGVRLVGRSFKYHRPRGIWGLGAEEPNALVELREGARREPNTRATTAELFEGLAARSQNRWPSLRFDVQAVNGLFGPILSAGFYYKTFMWPASFWEKVYEPLIRRAAGLGRAPEEVDPDAYERMHAHCDVLVIGAGPAGLAAALAAARSGARVILADEDAEPGGRLLADRQEIGGLPAADWAAQVLAELAGFRDVTLLPRTTVFGAFDHGTYGAVQRVADHLATPPEGTPRQRGWTIVARRAVLAAGAVERPIAFAGNDRPGVMSAAAVRGYLNRYAVLPGRRAVVFTAGDDGWRSAADLLAAGAEVTVVEARDAVAPAIAEAARGARQILGARVAGTAGGLGLAGVTLTDGQRLPADLLAVAGGWNPLLNLSGHHGARPRWDDALLAFVPDAAPPGMAVAGAAAGRMTLAACLADGAAAGLRAAEEAGHPGQPLALPRADDEPAGLRALFHVPGRGKAFVDFQHDVTADDIALAAREGFRSVEHAKRYTTLGMATDQGRTSNVTGLAILAAATGRSIAETGTTLFRPPYTPVAIGALAGHQTGRDFRPTRRTPLHGWAAGQGASFVESGAWLRAEWYARPGERGWRDSVDREAQAVRRDVGFCDVSTLGKIEVVGPDAAALLDLVYANDIASLKPGRIRYGVMLREDGFVFDDGTCARFAPDRFLLTTTTANAARVLQHLEYAHQVLRPSLTVALLSVTDAWAQVSLAGPRARTVLGGLLPGVALGNEAFPHMSCAEVVLEGGMPARLYRLSFSGELAYEIGVPPDAAAALADRLLAAGATPYGTEALGVLRIEKGHVGGGELNGQTTAGDLGLGRMLSRRKDFIGRALAQRPALVDPARLVLVGLLAGAVLRGGSHLLAPGAPATTAHDLGHVTSACWSPHLGRMIGLALLAEGRSRIGTRIRVHDPLRGGDTEAEVVEPVFIDREGLRSRG